MSQQIFETQVLTTPFHARTAALSLGNDWGRWAGYTVANCYDNVEEEYFAIRNSATLFDMSPMIKYRIKGPDAARYVNRLIPRDIDKVEPGRVIYTVWCNDAGHVLDDGTIFRFAADEFRLASQERHLPWLRDSAIGFDVEITDESDDVAGLALQGPMSCVVLKALGLAGIADMRSFGFARFDVGGIDLMVSRTGFTGDLGYELWVAPDDAVALWDRLMAAAPPQGLRAIGSGALDMARIDAGFIAANVDFMTADAALRATRGRSPFEIGLGWMVDFDKGHFNGRRALAREAETGSRYHIVGLDIAGNKPASQSLVYYGRQSGDVGFVTSAMWSPICKRNIAIATLKARYATLERGLWVDVYVNKELKWEKVHAPCRIVARPFFRHPRRTATPAGDI